MIVNTGTMMIGERLRLLREEQKLSQGDIEKRTGLLRCYISRVENGHTVPAIETLEKLARAMGPVSYTHLDVYKRQSQDPRDGPCQSLPLGGFFDQLFAPGRRQRIEPGLTVV